MDVIKVGKYTVTGRMAENITKEERENRLILLRDALIEQVKIDKGIK